MKTYFPLRVLLLLLLTTMGFTVALPSISAGADLSLMPWPARIEAGDGVLRLSHTLRMEVTGGDERVQHAITHFKQQWMAQTGLSVIVASGKSNVKVVLSIQCKEPGSKLQQLGEDESYQLVVDAKHIQLTARNPLGILRGVETVLQLLQKDNTGWSLPVVSIQDRPRFPWRGLMIDVSRHFIPLDVIERNIDGMTAVKLNTLHLHLSDDEGFRVESLRSPELQKLSSDGHYYTQKQIRELLAYARERGIRVVPEFDIPGHAVSWLVAHPSIASAPAPSHLVQGAQDGVRPPIDPTLEETYQVLDTVFSEMAGLFPDSYFHIGGDEVDGKYWDDNEKIQAWMREHNIKDNHALQTYFNQRVQTILAKYGKHMEGWDEILNPDLPKDTLVQSWRGPETLANAARMGFSTILSAGWYLDLMYPASQHYVVEPLSGESATLTDAQKTLILGGEAAQWTEYVTSEILDNRVWPRLGAIAERLWSPASVTSVDSMYQRLDVLSARLEKLGLLHRANSERMITNLAGKSQPPYFRTLADVVEPVKDYERGKTQSFNTQSPLNRLVDAVPPESRTGRKFNLVAQQAIQDPNARLELRKWFTRWKANDAGLQPFLSSTPSVQDLVPLSQSLAVLGSIGAEALDNIENGNSVTTEKHNAQLAAIDEAAKPHAELFLVVSAGVRQLVVAERIAQ